MVRIAPVNLQYNPKTLWFDAGGLEVRAGDGVVVTTARGTEFGRAADDVFEADEAQVKRLKSALKPVVRIATEADEAQVAEMERKSAEALPLFKELAAQTSDEMRPVSVEYLFDGDRAVFYFESENRVDFRELVRTLSSRLHVRVDMRQIGVRDEARIVGGLGHCGQELCCKRLGGEFCPVSIRMAKEQDLSLNPQKISGVCGRLMCCLRYEFDAYKDFKSRAPKKNAQVDTPAGPAKVVDLDVPREVVSLKVEGEKPVKVPLSAFDAPEEGTRPKAVGEQAWEEALSGEDAAAPKGAPAGAKGPAKPKGGEAPKKRRGPADAAQRPQGAGAGAPAGQGAGKKRPAAGGKQGGEGGPRAARPGQKSSGLRRQQQGGAPRDARKDGAGAPAESGASQHRRARRRSHKAGGEGGPAGAEAQGR